MRTSLRGNAILRLTAGLLPVIALGLFLAPQRARAAEPGVTGAEAKVALEKIGLRRGICVVLGLPRAAGATFVTDLAQGSELVVYFQSPVADEVLAVRQAARKARLLGQRVFADRGEWGRIHLADNLAGAVLVAPAVGGSVSEQELLRVLHPDGKAIIGERKIAKPFPEGTDSWSHPYHGPDNNPQSTDRLARAPYLTQFLAEPKFCPLPAVTVGAGGRLFKAFGHHATRANQLAVLNTLICVNSYNGTILWKRKLKESFLIHRNTMIATPEMLYLADDESCKVLDAETGEILREIVIPEGVADGPVWKWMALEGSPSVLYALVGGPELKLTPRTSTSAAIGHWGWGKWRGFTYPDPKTNAAWGRTLLAIEPDTGKILWRHDEQEYIDGRAVCMKNGRIYYYGPQKLLGCLDAKNGQVVWKTSDAELLRTVGLDDVAQTWRLGFATSAYMKCNEEYIFFAGPQRPRLVAVRTEDGTLAWHRPDGNYQLVLREDGIYAIGNSVKLDYESGDGLARFPGRRACTRATGSIDSVFYRASGGTVRIDVASGVARHIAPMRPPCHDGVVISDGLLYWGPWMCGCQLSLYGHICLAPAGAFNFRPGADESRLDAGTGDPAVVRELQVRESDWPTYRADNTRTGVTPVSMPGQVQPLWGLQLPPGTSPTAPIAAGGMVFLAGRDGIVRALDAANGTLRWDAFTGGAAFFPPALWQGRLYVGSADGKVHAFEAATGRRLWSFRAAPVQRWIPVYGKLVSTWPVAGGVVAEDGVVYAAAGIGHYDGTHVYALDAVTGKLKWYNDSSGETSPRAKHGVCLQGGLYIRDGELRFAGGTVYDTARYDLETGRFLNPGEDVVRSRFASAFYAYYPEYSQYVSLEHTLPDGKTLSYAVLYEGSRHAPLSLLAPLPPGSPELPAGWRLARARQGQPRPGRAALWTDGTRRRFNGFAVAPNALLAAGQPATGDGRGGFLTAINIEDGSDIWSVKLPAPAVKGGLAVDGDGRIFVCLGDDQVLCFAGAAAPTAP